VHLTFDTYRALSNLIWNLIQFQPWKLRPPMTNMPSPVLGYHEPPARSRRPSRTRVTRWDYSEFSEEPLAIADHTVTISDTEIKAIERGPWANSEVQDTGPMISPEDWSRLRGAANAGGYKPSSHPRGYYPG